MTPAERTLTLGLCMLVASCGVPDAGEAVASSSAPVDGHVEVGGVNLHYRDYGGEGDLLVFVPGFFMTAHVFDPLAPRFTDRYRVLSVTRRWHGTSDTTGRDFDLDTLANDLAGFIDHFTDDPAVVVGWATAGLELPKLARSRPDLVRTLVFANAVWASVPLPSDVPRWPPGATTPDSAYPSLEAAADHLGPAMSITSRSAVLAVLAGSLYRREDGMYAWLPPFGTPTENRFLAYYDSSAVYDGLDAPVLAIRVELSDALAADLASRGYPRDSIDLAVRWARDYDDVSNSKGIEALRAAVPNADVVVLDDVSHNFMINAPDVVARVIRDFLDGV